MTLDQLSQYLTWILYLLVFAVVVVRAVRDPMRANIDIALLFGLPGLMILCVSADRGGAIADQPFNECYNRGGADGHGLYAVAPRV